MAVFREEDLGRLDWRMSYLDEDLGELGNLGYRIVRFNCSLWKTPSECASDLSSKLNIQWNGNSLDALNDLLADVDVPIENGLVLAFVKFDSFSVSEPELSLPILDILASNGRLHLLFGRRLICMLQVDEPALEFQPVGAQPICWNPRERFHKNRGL